MKVSSLELSWTLTAWKIFSGLRGKLYDHNDSSSLSHSKTLTAIKRWFSRYVIAAMLVDENKRFLISSFCSSTSNCTLQHCYLYLCVWSWILRHNEWKCVIYLINNNKDVRKIILITPTIFSQPQDLNKWNLSFQLARTFVVILFQIKTCKPKKKGRKHVMYRFSSLSKEVYFISCTMCIN